MDSDSKRQDEHDNEFQNSEPSFQPYNDHSQQTLPISASPQRSANQSPERISPSHDISQSQIQEQLRQQEVQHQNAINMYLQIIRFYDQNLMNLKNLILSKETELKAKTLKVTQLQSLIEQIQTSFQAICHKYESENAELMQRYMQTIEEFNRKSRQPERQQSPEVVLELVQLKYKSCLQPREKFVECSQRKSSLEMTVREMQLRQTQDQKTIQELRSENQMLHTRVQYLTQQANQKSVSPPNHHQMQQQSLPKLDIPKHVEFNERQVAKKLNKSDIQIHTSNELNEPSLLQSYSIGARVSHPKAQSEQKESLSSKLQSLNNRRSQLENELNKFPLHVRNLSEKRRRQHIEDSLHNLEEEISFTRQELTQIR